jgi:hypothetical protein
MSKVNLPICRWERTSELMGQEGQRLEVIVGNGFSCIWSSLGLGVVGKKCPER